MFVFGTFESVLGQSTTKIEVKTQNKPKYKTVNSKYIEYEGKTLLLDVFIEPKFLNPADLKILARKIKASYPKENKISIGFFTDKQAAKNFYSLHQHDKNYEKHMEAFRGSYHFNRANGEESLSFVPFGKSVLEGRKEISLDRN